MKQQRNYALLLPKSLKAWVENAAKAEMMSSGSTEKWGILRLAG